MDINVFTSECILEKKCFIDKGPLIGKQSSLSYEYIHQGQRSISGSKVNCALSCFLTQYKCMPRSKVSHAQAAAIQFLVLYRDGEVVFLLLKKNVWEMNLAFIRLIPVTTPENKAVSTTSPSPSPSI